MEPPPDQASCVTAWTEVKVQLLLGQRKEESAGQVPVQEGIPLGDCSVGQM